MIYGYARCSTNDTKQDLQYQVRELKELGATDSTIYKEYISGASTKKPEWTKLLQVIQEGDSIIVTEVSRISRSTKQLCEIIELIQQRKLKLVIKNSLTIDCTKGELDPMTKAFLQMSGVFCELEREMTKARVKSGVANAKANGKRVGRPALTVDHVKENTKFMHCYKLWKAGYLKKTEIRKLTSLSRTTIDVYINALEGK